MKRNNASEIKYLLGSYINCHSVSMMLEGKLESTSYDVYEQINFVYGGTGKANIAKLTSSELWQFQHLAGSAHTPIFIISIHTVEMIRLENVPSLVSKK
jgi:hypothetical protein